MFCAISGETPQEPVVSARSGLLFERRLVLKHLAAAGTDPVTGEPTTAEDLVEIKSTPKFVKPRPPAASSIPTLLLTLQNEWDSVMLETHELRQQLHSTRVELAAALYEHDAARRVIARLIKERDDARRQLADFSATAAAHAAAHPAAAAAPSSTSKTPISPKPAKAAPAQQQAPSDMAVDSDTDASHSVLPPAVVESIDSTCSALSAVRRGRKPPPTLAAVDRVAQYAVQAETKTLHTAKHPASLSIDLLVDNDREDKISWIVSAGKDGSVHIVDGHKAGAAIASTKAHDGAVNAVVWMRRSNPADADELTSFVTGGADKSVKVWTFDPSLGARSRIKNKLTIDAHEDEVTGVSVHPTGNYAVSAGLDSVWAFLDLESGNVLYSVKGEKTSIKGYTAIQFHPDGAILATGSNDGLVRIWDVKTQANVHTFEGHTGPISSIAFSENGYYLATSSASERVVKFWDLRKLVNFYNLELAAAEGVDSSAEGDKDAADLGVARVRFDQSGQYVGIVIANELRVHLIKKWTEIGVWGRGEWDGALTDLAFGPDAGYMFASGTARRLAYIAAPEE